MTAFAKPILVHLDGSRTLLNRTPLGGGDGGFDERWLQEALFKNPASIPIQEIDPHAGALIPVCMELETGAGPADIFFVTRTGQLVLVETKLWRNAEARRTVVAQILDYAKQLSGWTFEDLNRQTAMASKQGPGHLLACARKAHPDLDEASFVDGINRSLRTGDFVLIIAGDGIREGAQTLVAFIERYGNLRFALALIEVAAYRLPDASMLLQPRILAKTEILQRTVFVGQNVDDAIDALADGEGIPADPERLAANARVADWFEQFWKEYLSALQLDDIQQPKPAKPARSTNIFLPQPPGGSQAWISAYLARSQNQGGVFLTFGRSLASAADLYEALYSERDEIAKVVPNLSWQRGGDGKVWIQVPTIALGDLDDPDNRAKVVGHLAAQSNAMVNAFRHRLERLSKERSTG